MSTALAVVESQQQVVGRSLVGGAVDIFDMQSEGPCSDTRTTKRLIIKTSKTS